MYPLLTFLEEDLTGVGVLDRAAEETKQVMQRIAAKGFAKRLIDQAHDQRDIEVVNLKLTDILRLFNAVTEPQIAQDVAIGEGARKNDQYQCVLSTTHCAIEAGY